MVGIFMQSLALELGVKPFSFSQDDLARLQTYRWPGNVRELKNLVERALLLGSFPWEAVSANSGQAESAAPIQTASEFSADLTLEQVEKQHMLHVLNAADGNKSEAARRLGISRKTMERKLRSWPELS
jgi:two-component system NtrC family response regulator